MPTKKKKTKAKAGTKSSKKPPTAQPSVDSDAVLLLFLPRVLQWLKNNYARATDLFRKFDNNGDDCLTCDDFIVAMKILEAPITRSETEHLVKIIDPNGDGQVNILEFDKVIRAYHHSLLRASSLGPSDEGDESGRPTISSLLSPRVSTKCPSCQIGVAEPPLERNPRFIKLKVVLAPFKDTPSHPGHFQVEVSDSTTVHGLKDTIQTHLEGAVESVALFREATCSKSSYLMPSWCLKDCGILGGRKTEPSTAEVFYDYVSVVMDCPILMTDSHIQDVPLAGARDKKM